MSSASTKFAEISPHSIRSTGDSFKVNHEDFISTTATVSSEGTGFTLSDLEKAYQSLTNNSGLFQNKKEAAEQALKERILRGLYGDDEFVGDEEEHDRQKIQKLDSLF